jgi:hypothetical protein
MILDYNILYLPHTFRFATCLFWLRYSYIEQTQWVYYKMYAT